MNNIFKINEFVHAEGDRRCLECWAGYPKKCQCGGLIHAQFIKERWEELNVQCACDACGPEFKYEKKRKSSRR